MSCIQRCFHRYMAFPFFGIVTIRSVTFDSLKHTNSHTHTCRRNEGTNKTTRIEDVCTCRTMTTEERTKFNSNFHERICTVRRLIPYIVYLCTFLVLLLLLRHFLTPANVPLFKYSFISKVFFFVFILSIFSFVFFFLFVRNFFWLLLFILSQCPTHSRHPPYSVAHKIYRHMHTNRMYFLVLLRLILFHSLF